jgi:hypothetical protein
MAGHLKTKASDHINPENLDYSNVNLYISHLSNKTNIVAFLFLVLEKIFF